MNACKGPKCFSHGRISAAPCASLLVHSGFDLQTAEQFITFVMSALNSSLKNSSGAASLCRHVFDIWARDAKCCSVNGTSSPWQTPPSSYSNLCESQCLEMSRITLTSHPFFLNASPFHFNLWAKNVYFCLFFPAFSRTNKWIIWAVPGPPWSALSLSCLTESCWQRPWRDAAPAWSSPGSSASMAGKLLPSAAWSCLLKMELPHWDLYEE